jgi:CheY-like chemotaxis protein
MISVAKRAVILIVEDELLIRMHAVEMIEEAFEVVEAASADEAIAILEARLDITVVFTNKKLSCSGHATNSSCWRCRRQAQAASGLIVTA